VITSSDNPKVKQVRALLNRRGREQQAHCLVEGVRLVEDAMRAGMHPALVFYVADDSQTPRAQALLAAARASQVPCWEVSPAVFGTLSDTVTSQGILAIVPIPKSTPGADASLLLVLDQVRDPGNVGTILRSAEAAGADGVLLTVGCADPWSPKVLRAGMGAHFRLALQADMAWTDIVGTLAGRPLWVADARGAIPYDEPDWTQSCALAIGGEAQGASASALANSRGAVTIPMRGGAESLNAAMAATVLLFEVARQRRACPRQ
jgi:TrmH family RNA methyltransferase